jgi:hypothetical protein
MVYFLQAFINYYIFKDIPIVLEVKMSANARFVPMELFFVKLRVVVFLQWLVVMESQNVWMNQMR